jgi:alkylresorcinol/alkylpyrone synthase
MAAASHSTIVATATALPPHIMTREDMKYYLERVFDIPERRLEALMSIVENAHVNKRHSIFPINYTIEPRPLSKTNDEYIEHAVKLGREAAEKCLERAGMKPDEIDLIITVSCTGFMIPSLDAHLINLMGFRSNIRRMPFTELGCAAGAMALGRAADFLTAHPGGNVLIIAAELPTLTFQRKDISQANLISSILFGDGAAAVIVSGKPMRGPKSLASETYTFPDSLGAMGFDLKDSGFTFCWPRRPGNDRREDRRFGFRLPGAARPEARRDQRMDLASARALLRNVETELVSGSDTQPSWTSW